MTQGRRTERAVEAGAFGPYPHAWLAPPLSAIDTCLATKYHVAMNTTEPLQGLRRHKLLTLADRGRLPQIKATDGLGDDAIAYVKFFCAFSRYTLYVTEFDGEDELYGFCVSALGSDCDEWGYASLSDLAGAKWASGTPMIERDCYWTPVPVARAIQ